MLQSEPIRRRKLYEEIVVRLETAIFQGRVASGDQLPSERELMETYGVGRTSVREALFALQRMGLISISSGERARVTQPTPEALVNDLSGAARHLLAQPAGMKHFQQARLFFEVSLARHAAEHAIAEDVAALTAALDANKRAIGRSEVFERTDVMFHYVIARIARNPIFTALHAALAEWLMEQRTTSIRAKGAERAAYRAHANIHAAILGREPDAAAAAMRDHLEQVSRFYWAVKGSE